MTILAAVASGVLVLLAGSLPWAALASANLRVGTTVPWALVPMAAYLLAYWLFLDGRWGAADGAGRRALLRANPLATGTWMAALAAGMLGFAALLAFLSVGARLVVLPESAPLAMPPEMPVATVVAVLVMQSIVAGVTEEAAFRGYMQGPIERRYGLALAVLVSGTAFGLLHFGNHPADVVLMLPYYVAVSAVYGGLTWAVDSILPAVVLHAAGDVVVLVRWWATGRPEWQIGSTATGLVWDGGVDAAFVTSVGVLVVLGVATALAYRALARRIVTR